MIPNAREFLNKYQHSRQFVQYWCWHQNRYSQIGWKYIWHNTIILRENCWAINPAAYSLFPSARSFQTTTIAIQREPNKDYTNHVFRISIQENANANIKIRPRTQFKNRKRLTLVFLKTSPICSYLLLPMEDTSWDKSNC
jgi:hypothetical protein